AGAPGRTRPRQGDRRGPRTEGDPRENSHEDPGKRGQPTDHLLDAGAGGIHSLLYRRIRSGFPAMQARTPPALIPPGGPPRASRQGASPRTAGKTSPPVAADAASKRPPSRNGRPSR